MSKTWFAGTFCPNEATCSLEDGALSPSNGPKIRTLELTETRETPFTSTVQIFTDAKSFQDAYTDPRQWAKCEGQIMPISGNDAIFSLLGTNYGGDGRVTFGIPDLRASQPDNYYIYIVGFIRD